MSNRSLYQVQRFCSMVQKFFISVPCNGGLRPSRFFVQAGGGGRRRGAPYTQRTHTKAQTEPTPPRSPDFKKSVTSTELFCFVRQSSEYGLLIRRKGIYFSESYTVAQISSIQQKTLFSPKKRAQNGAFQVFAQRSKECTYKNCS